MRPTSELQRPSSNLSAPSARLGLCGACDSRNLSPVLELNRFCGPFWSLRRARLPSFSACRRAQPLARLSSPTAKGRNPDGPAPVFEPSSFLGPVGPLRRIRLPSSRARPLTQPPLRPASASASPPTPEIHRPSSNSTGSAARSSLSGAPESRGLAPVLGPSRSLGSPRPLQKVLIPMAQRPSSNPAASLARLGLCDASDSRAPELVL